MFLNPENNDVNPLAITGTESYDELESKYKEMYCKDLNAAADGPDIDEC